MLPHILVLARSPRAARAGRSRFCWDEERGSRTATKEAPVQKMGAMLTERDTGSHSPLSLHEQHPDIWINMDA